MAKILSLYFVLIASIFFSGAIAQTSTSNKLNSEQQNIQAQEESEWVVVLDDPRPARLQGWLRNCLLYTSPSPRDRTRPRMPSSA